MNKTQLMELLFNVHVLFHNFSTITSFIFQLIIVSSRKQKKKDGGRNWD